MEIEISGDEARHLRALRLRQGDRVEVTNGQGLSAATLIVSSTKTHYSLSIKELFDKKGEPARRTGLALGILASREAMEFALEKAVELGITDFFPLSTEFTQKKAVNIERMMNKAIAAIKQCKRSCLPAVHPVMNITEVLELWEPDSRIILTDYDGGSPETATGNSPVLVFVGCEGGFSEQEVNIIKNDKRAILWRLAPRRLRAETAAIVALSYSCWQ